ncbi:MAG: hypothetical protein IT384_01910 [Deltaproteobacteria bacterium]|nr:hypothetical protein [Deltaproteobacteria bacterium]
MGNVVKLKSVHAPLAKKPTTKPELKKELDRKSLLLDQFGIKKPLELDDNRSILTIDPSVGATQVDTYAKVPSGGQHDGLIVKLTQTDWSTARVEGEGVEAQKTVPPRTMAGAFGWWASRNGAMTLAGKEYARSDLDRDTGEVVLSDMGVDKNGNTVLETRRLRPSAGAELSGEMLTTLPPKVGLMGFPAEFKPEPALLVADPKTKLVPGSTIHVSGKSVEHLNAEVTSSVRPSQGGWTDPDGAQVEIDTWLRVQNADRAPIHHEAVVLRSADNDKKSYYDDNDKPTTIHTTTLPHAKLAVGPGESQEIHVEKQKGRAHVEYRIGDSVQGRSAGAGEMTDENTADRYMVLENSAGKRHAGAVKFFDGIDELGVAHEKAASPGGVSTTSDQRSSGLTARSKTEWSALQGTENAQKKTQTVTKEWSFKNISPVAGQLKIALDVEGFSEVKSIKVNGKELKTSLHEAAFSASLESKSWGGSKVAITIRVPSGSESTPSTAKLELEVSGKINVYEN